MAQRKRSRTTAATRKPELRKFAHGAQPQPAVDPLFLSRRQVAERTGLNLELIDRAIKQGDLTASKIGRRVLISPTAVTAWIQGAQI